ncbi:hypothetical protein ABK040_004693 [Willaertia magna]
MPKGISKIEKMKQDIEVEPEEYPTQLSEVELNYITSVHGDVTIEENLREETVVEKFSWFKMLKDTFLKFSIIGSTCFIGGIGVLLQKECCDKWKWLTDQQFMELYVLATLLPGPTLSQIAFGMSLQKYGFVSAFLANIIFNGPGFVLSLIAGLVMSNVNIKEDSPLWLKNAQFGLACSGIAFAASSAFRLASQLHKDDAFVYLIVGLISFSTLLYKPMWFLPVLIVLGGVCTWVYFELKEFFEIRINIYMAEFFQKGQLSWRDKIKLCKLVIKNIRQPVTSTEEEDASSFEGDPLKEEEPKPTLKLSPWIGSVYLVLFVVIFVCLTIPTLVTEFIPRGTWIEFLRVNEFFYRMGTFIFGGLDYVIN